MWHTNHQAVPTLNAASTRHNLWLQWQLGSQTVCQHGHQLVPLNTIQQLPRCQDTAAAGRKGTSAGQYGRSLQTVSAFPRKLQQPTVVTASFQEVSSCQNHPVRRHDPQQPLAAAERILQPSASNRANRQRCQVSASELLPYPEATDSYQQLLCDTLHITPSDAQLVLLTTPAVATLTPQQLRANWSQLQQLLPVKQHMILQAILQLPDLLVSPQTTVAARLAEASDVLQRPVRKLRSHQQQWTPLLHWSLLCTPREQLVQKLLQLQQILGLQQQQLSRRQQTRQWEQPFEGQQQWHMKHVVSLVCDAPGLLHVDEAQLISSVEALEQVCTWPASRLLPGLIRSPQLLLRPADDLYKAAATLQQQLKLSEEGLALALKRAPGALLIHADQLQRLLAELSHSLAVPTDVAADICLQEPQVLLRGPGAVGRVLTALRSIFKLSSEELLQVVEFDPTVLCRSPGELSENSSKFRELALSCKPWAVEYTRLMSKPVNVARALRIEPLRLQRLIYLQRHRLTRMMSLKAAVSMSGRQFTMAFPGYSAWLAEKYSAGNAPKQFRDYGTDESEDEE